MIRKTPVSPDEQFGVRRQSILRVIHADPPQHAHMGFRSSHPARERNHKDQADLTAKKRVIHLHPTDPADRTDHSDHADPPTQSYSSVIHGTCKFD